MRLTNEEARQCGLNVPKQNKMKNEPCVIDGIRFQSEKEGQRYAELMLELHARVISMLSCQYPFDYKDDRRDKVLFTYRADFRYRLVASNIWIFEDVKPIDKKTGKTPMTAAYRMFLLKKKLIEDRFGITITEV